MIGLVGLALASAASPGLAQSVPDDPPAAVSGVAEPGVKIIAEPRVKIIAEPGVKIIAEPGDKIIAEPGDTIIAEPGDKIIAEQAPEPVLAPLPAGRSGWFLGGGIGVGSIAYAGNASTTGDDSFSGMFFDARFGGMLSPAFSIAIELRSDGHRFSDTPSSPAATQNTFAIVASYWATPRLSLNAGFGSSRLTLYQFGSVMNEHDGRAFMGGASYELMSHSHLAMDLSLQLISSSYGIPVDSFPGDLAELERSSASVNLGLSWR